jgi:transcriptional regulator with XRE-family HTH domain
MPKDQVSALGDRVRKRRKALGLTAKALAKAAGVSTSYISQVERGHQQDPSLPALRRLADALSMDLHALLGAQATKGEPASIPGALRELAEEFRLGPETLEMLAAVQIDGRQPSSREDWLFLLLAIRRSCRILEPLAPHTAVGEKGDKYALRN